MNIKKMIGEKVILSPLDSREAERLVHWVNDLEGTLGTTLAATSMTLDKETEMLKQMEQGGRDFYIVARDSRQPIGTCGITNWDPINQWASVGIMIGERNYHNQGCGSEALALLCDYCFNLLNCHSVHLEVYSYNLPSPVTKRWAFKNADAIIRRRRSADSGMIASRWNCLRNSLIPAG